MDSICPCFFPIFGENAVAAKPPRCSSCWSRTGRHSSNDAEGADSDSESMEMLRAQSPGQSSDGLHMYMYVYIYIYINIVVYIAMYMYICVHVYMHKCVYMWSRVPCSYPPTPQWYGSPGSTPLPSICQLLAAFLRSSLVFARSLQHFWLPASHLLGTCYLLDDLRSTHTPSEYLHATYSHVYMCYVSTSYLLPVYPHNTTCV